MAAMAPPRPTDDFDMTKLKKSLKQRQRHSIRNSPHVTKLTPAEIRSLNYSAVVSQTGSQSSSKGTSPARSTRSTRANPPANFDQASTPGGHSSKKSISRNSSVNVSTETITPTARRGSSQSSSHGTPLTQGKANGSIQSPHARGSGQAAFMVANGISSRPSSSGSSIYRGLPTYRGPEVTRTGSMNMIQRPPPNIVANPLSYFSRPRQSVAGSPDRCRHGSQDSGVTPTQSLRSTRTNSLPSIRGPSARPTSPPRVTDSPVSMLVDETEKFPVLDADDPHNQPKIYSEEEESKSEAKQKQSEGDKDDATASLVIQQPQVQESESPKKSPKKRFTIGAALFGKDRRHTIDGADNAAKLKNIRRRTISGTIERESQPSPAENTSHGTPGEGAKMGEATPEDGPFVTHPAVRPLSLIIPGDFKGKEKRIDAGPVYARCDCCGRLKRPPGFSSELSPVLENEHLRTNFSFEIERTSPTVRRRSSDVSRDKFTPIIPIEVGENKTRQATIEPYKSPVSPVAQPTTPKKANPRKPKRNSDPPRFVRFGSLHGRRNVDPTIIDEEEEVEADVNEPPLARQEGEEVKIQNNAVVEEGARSQPVVTKDEDKDGLLVEPQQTLISSTKAAAPDSPRSPKPESPSPNFSRPNPRASPQLEHQRGEQYISSRPNSSGEQIRPMLCLPEPSFGPQFARTNTILRSFVFEPTKPVADRDSGLGMEVPSPTMSSHDLTAAATMKSSRAQQVDSDIQKGQKWVAEVMAV